MNATRRRRRSGLARFRVVFGVLLVALGIALSAAASWQGFLPHRITVRGNHEVSERTIVGRAAIDAARNVWLQDMGAAAARVREIPYIRDVRISRRLPAFVTIQVNEREPFAAVVSGRARFVVDRDLRLLPRYGKLSPLPVFELAATPNAQGFARNPKLVRMRNDYLALHDAHFAIALLRLDRFGDLQATTRNGVKFLLGDDGALLKKIAMIDPILSQVAQGHHSITTIDLRTPAAPVVVYRR